MRGVRNFRIKAIGFSLVGVANTALTLTIIIALQSFTRADPYAANAIGYAAGLPFSFSLNSRWIFSQTHMRVEDAARFLVVFLIAYGANLAFLHALMGAGSGANLAQILAIPIYTATFFLLCMLFVFTQQEMQIS